MVTGITATVPTVCVAVGAVRQIFFTISTFALAQFLYPDMFHRGVVTVLTSVPAR